MESAKGRNDKRAKVGCDIHAHAPAQEKYTNFLLYPLALQIVVGMGMGTNVTAQKGQTEQRKDNTNNTSINCIIKIDINNSIIVRIIAEV